MLYYRIKKQIFWTIQLTCQHLGYSQSRSRPSKLFSSMKSTTWLTKRLLAEGLLTSFEYLSPAESFHPPIAIKTFMPLALRAVTFS